MARQSCCGFEEQCAVFGNTAGNAGNILSIGQQQAYRLVLLRMQLLPFLAQRGETITGKHFDHCGQFA